MLLLEEACSVVEVVITVDGRSIVDRGAVMVVWGEGGSARRKSPLFSLMVVGDPSE